MDLATSYLGLSLRNPLVASASPLSNTVDGVRRLADAGVSAVVLYSLFEEQVRREMAENARLAEAGTEVFAESLSYFPAAVEEGSAAEDAVPRRYLSLLERAAAAVDVPVIGSLNGVTPGGWSSYARAIQDAGAAAVELKCGLSLTATGTVTASLTRRRMSMCRCSTSRPVMCGSPGM